jgi:hypothetical protein
MGYIFVEVTKPILFHEVHVIVHQTLCNTYQNLRLSQWRVVLHSTRICYCIVWYIRTNNLDETNLPLCGALYRRHDLNFFDCVAHPNRKWHNPFQIKSDNSELVVAHTSKNYEEINQ